MEKRLTDPEAAQECAQDVDLRLHWRSWDRAVTRESSMGHGWVCQVHDRQTLLVKVAAWAAAALAGTLVLDDALASPVVLRATKPYGLEGTVEAILEIHRIWPHE